MKKIKTLFVCANPNNNKNKKHFFVATFFLISAFFMGCDKKQEVPPVEITLVSGWGGTYQSHEVMREIYEEFDRQNEDIKLNFVPYSDNAIAVDNAIDMLAIGEEPDIVSTNGLSSYVEYAVRYGEALDLSPYIGDDQELKSQIHPAVFEIWETEQGELYTIPDALEVAGYWYNKDILRQAGVTNMHGDVAIPGTWIEFKEMLESVQRWIEKEKKDISVFALEEDQIKGSFFLARLAGNGEEGLDSVTVKYPMVKEEILQAVMEDIKIIRNYSKDVNNIEDARQKFLEGESVIFFGGVWEADEFIKSSYKDDIGFACYPTYNGKSLSYVSASSGYVIAKQDSDRKTEACIRFIKYILSKPVQEKIALMTSQAPSNISVSMEQISDRNPLLGSALKDAYMADIQIPTIYSVWKEEQIDAIEEMIENR